MKTSGPKNDQALLLDYVIRVAGADNDAGLARLLEVAQGNISKMRHKKLPIGPAIIIRIHEATGIAVRDIKQMVSLTCLASLALGAKAPSI